MDPKHDHPNEGEPPAIQGRADSGGRWSAAWPLLALALIGLMVVQSCVPSPPASPAAPPASAAPSPSPVSR